MRFFELALTLVVVASATAEWDRAEALDAIRGDATSYLSYVVGKEKEFIANIRKYKSERRKGQGTKCASAVKACAKFLKSPFADTLDNSQRNALYETMLELAEAINGTFTEMTPYIEGVPMRGWPFNIGLGSPSHRTRLGLGGWSIQRVEFDAFQGGLLMQAVAYGAEQAALHGEHGKAASLVMSVAAALHDGFLTSDLKRTKVDSNGAVVFVPEGGSLDRFKRSASIQDDRVRCLDHPQALNHGLRAAEGAAVLLRACNVIDWDEAEWRLVDADGLALTRKSFIGDVEAFVVGTADVLLKAFTIHTTGTSSKDRYNGPDGTEWYLWKYFAHPCPESINTELDRWEDIAHAAIDFAFISSIRNLGRDYYGSADYFLDTKHLRRLQVTCLNRLIVDRSIAGGGRFACDISGTTTDRKSCGGSRAESTRHLLIPRLMSLPVELKDDPITRCDALSMADAGLSLFMADHPDFVQKMPMGQYYVLFMEAKYHFYNFKAALRDC